MCALFAAGGVAAQDSDARLEDVERALREEQSRGEDLDRTAASLRAEVASLTRDSVAAARRAQDLETELSGLEESLARLEAEQVDKIAELAARRAQLTQTLGALQRLAVQPSEALLVGPGAPVDRARSALLLKVAIPAVEERARGLRLELEELALLRADIEANRAGLAATSEALGAERTRLDGLIARKKVLYATTLSERMKIQARAEVLAKEARNLVDLIARLEKDAREREERRKAEEARRKAERAARLAAVAEARRKVEEAARLAVEAEARRAAQRATEEEAIRDAEREVREQAARLAAEAEARRVESERAESERAEAAETQQALAVPLDRPGTIRPFPDRPSQATMVMPARGRLVTLYGQDLVGEEEGAKGITISTRPGAQVVAPYDGQVVYAGAFRGYGQILIIEHGGRYHSLLAGLERIDAVVGQWILAGEPVGVMDSPQGPNPELYLELRRVGQPINPLPWLATTNNKVQG